MCFKFLNSSGGIVAVVIHTLIHTMALLRLNVVGRLPEKKT